jgi:catechol 2,3-dioxygenase
VNTRLVSQLAHVEIVTPELERCRRFHVDVLGMEESAHDGSSAWLRGWGDWFHHSLQLSAGEEVGLGHIAWRAAGPEELELAVARLEAQGRGGAWADPAPGHGPAYRFLAPSGQPMEILWEVERFLAPPDLASTYPNRPQRHVGRGCAVRQLDHVTFPCVDLMADAAWFRDTFGFRLMEWTALGEEVEVPVFAMVSSNEQSHDVGLLHEPSERRGRVHHVAFWVDQVTDLHRAADILLEAGHEIEFGPGKHGMGENNYLYVRDHGGVRVELFSGGYRNYQPDWEPVRWSPSQGSNDFYRNTPMPDSFLEAYPPAGAMMTPREGVNPWAAGSVS